MVRLSGFVLRHKLLVVATWSLLLIAGFASLGNTTSRLPTTFSVPNEPAFKADARIMAIYHSGTTSPTILTLEAPPGTSWQNAQDRSVAARAFAAAGKAVPDSRVADAADTGDARFFAGGYAFAIDFTPPGNGPFGGALPTGQVESAAARSLPSGWAAGATGLAQLEAGSQSQKGPGSWPRR
jgi:putative drug exporter of the RND superfamily